MKRSLIVVDAQRGFTELHPDELPVPGGLAIVANINRLLELSWARIDATQDWHPPDHCSFRGQRDNIYPPHCVADTLGADFIPGIHVHKFHTIWRKGIHRHLDTYSVVQQHPGLAALWIAEGITETFVCGLATNICCFQTASDLKKHGLKTAIIEDASAGIDVPHANLFQHTAKQSGLKMGIQYVSTDDVIALFFAAGTLH